MIRHAAAVVAASAVAVLAGCAQMPTGPSVAVMPAPNKPFEVFMQDEQMCRQYAASQLGNSADQANGSAAGKAVGGAALGAAAGALMANNSRGAGVGA
ncbi:MAG TPA: hypothetical protein VHE37_10465, partial [Nevskiaceae bacterium]|nr:hypothetical protein [Nevskiaceae bacterium]